MSETEQAGGGDGPEVGTGAYFAVVYGVAERTIKRWKATGKGAGDEVPLERPEEMRGWWSRNMKQREPDGINVAVIRWRRENPVGSGPGVAAEEQLGNCDKSQLSQAKVVDAADGGLMELPVVAPVPDSDKAAARRALMDLPIEEGEIGTEQTLRRTQEMEVRLSRLAGDPGGAKPWLDTVARIGPLAEKLRVESERMRRLIPKAEAEEVIQALHVPIKNEIYMLGATMCQVLGVPVTPAIEDLWRVECDRIFHRLKNEVFAA